MNLMLELLETGRYVIFAFEPLFDREYFHYIEVDDVDIFIEFHLVVNKRAFINSAAEHFIAWTREQFTRLNQAADA